MSIGTIEERAKFTARLRSALERAGHRHDSPTDLARNFNARCMGCKPVTIHAARKWIMGEAIPLQNKIQIMASWLHVSAEWLRFGTETAVSDETAQPMITIPNPSQEHVVLVSDVMRLNSKYVKLARNLITTLVQMQNEDE